MEVYTREAAFWKAIATGNLAELPDPINAKEHYMRQVALKLAGGISAENALEVSIPKGTTDFLGKKVSQLVSDIAILMDGEIARVSGNIFYVKDFKAFNESVPEQQEGYYFPFELSESGCSTMSFVKNGSVTKKDIAYDPQILFRIDNPETQHGVITDTGKKVIFDFSGLIYLAEGVEPEE